jgi:hypothetical protein
MYYTITDLVFDTDAATPRTSPVVIYNKSGNILSITDVKITFTERTTVAKPFYVDIDVIQELLDKMNGTFTPGEPGTESDGEPNGDFNPEVTVSYPTKTYTGQTYKINVEVDQEVSKVQIAGKDATLIDGIWVGEFIPNDTDSEQTITVEVTSTANETVKKTVKVNTTVYFDPAWTIWVPDVAESGTQFDVVITAGNPVKELRVNGAELILKNGAWRTTLTATGDKLDVAVEATNEKGLASETWTKTVAVQDVDESLAEVSISSNTTVPNSAVKVTVKTGKDVKAVLIDGWLVTTYTESGNDRIWTRDVIYENVGTHTVRVMVYKDDTMYASSTWIKTVTVSETAAKAQVITTVISRIVDNLRRWLNWGV